MGLDRNTRLIALAFKTKKYNRAPSSTTNNRSDRECCLLPHFITYIRRFGLCIPAVTGIMSHFILHMLSEAQLLRGYTDLCKEEVDSANEVTQNRVIDHTLEREKARKNTQTNINS